METYSSCCGVDMAIYDDNGEGFCPDCKEMCNIIEDNYTEEQKLKGVFNLKK